MDTLADRRQLGLYGLAIFLMVFGAEFNLGQRILGTVSLTGNQWLVCIVLAFALILIDEVVKFFMRRARRGTGESRSRQACSPAGLRMIISHSSGTGGAGGQVDILSNVVLSE